MAPAPHTCEHRPHSPVVNFTHDAGSMAGTRGTACGCAKSMFGLASRYWLNAVACFFVRREATVVWSDVPAGHTKSQAPHTWHCSLFSSNAGFTSRLAPRPNMLIAPRPMRSPQTFTHSPHRIQSPLGFLSNGVDVTPSVAANSAIFFDAGAWARRSSRMIFLLSRTPWVSVETFMLLSTG